MSPDDVLYDTWFLHPKDVIHGHWYASFKVRNSDTQPCDIVGILIRQGHDGRLMYHWRFRYDAGTGNMYDDRKSAYSADVSQKTPEEAIAMIARMFDGIADIHPHPLRFPVDFVRINGDATKLMATLSKRKWFHAKLVEFPDAGEVIRAARGAGVPK